uniref:Bm10024 n=1 Tax=Brugia malayi TaxID=6279 RepID=A0A1I9G2V1_BRUMA|nr:Bm10024 [Brugia malayi]
MKSACSPAAIIGTVPCTLPYWSSHLVSLVQHVSLVRHVIFTPTSLLEYCKIQGETMVDGWMKQKQPSPQMATMPP